MAAARLLARAAAIAALAAAIGWWSAPGLAQDAGQTDSANGAAIDPPGGFSLRPAPSPRDPDVQGPVDAQSSLPRRIDPEPNAQPAEAPAPRTAPIASIPVPTLERQPRTDARSTPQSRADPEPAAPRRAERVPPKPAPPVSNSAAPDSGPPGIAGPVAAAPSPGPPGPGPTPRPSWPDWLIPAGLVAILLAALAMIWRLARWRHPQRRGGDTPAPAPIPAAALGRPATVRPAAALPDPQIDFALDDAEMTLLNAVVHYRLRIANPGPAAIADVALHAVLGQAGRDLSPQVDAAAGLAEWPAIAALPVLAPGAAQVVTGTLRLPLATIEPIRHQGRMLFVPVVRIAIGFAAADGRRGAIGRAFVLGEEQSPPGPRVAPLRLELGPRRLPRIGQRRLEAA